MISVGFDIRPLIFTRAGIRTYLYNLIVWLARTNGCGLHLFISSKSGIDWAAVSPHISEELIRLPHINEAWGRFWETFMLTRGVKKRRCDVFHGARFFVPQKLSCPSVVSIHDVAFKRFPQFVTPKAFEYFDRAVAASARSASKIIVCSHATRADLEEFYGVPASKISVVYDAAGREFSGVRDTARLKALKQRLGIKGGFLLSAGTIEPRKNYVNLLKAYALLKAGRDLPLVIVGGNGWLFGDVFEEINRLGLRGRVILAGYVDDLDLAQLYCACELFVFPSFYEGFGLPVLEALQSGACVVASATSSIKELFASCTFQVAPESPESIAEGMERVLNDGPLRTSLIEAGKRRAADFSWEKTALETLAVYNTLVAKRL
ncbi:MAG TPA: glycosyltransferase family 1 protein [Candidatus Omnitrophota bacterium]|nr:glycosyltransferase family 1 protein [Candidatus Omnitrophota bacterium]